MNQMQWFISLVLSRTFGLALLERQALPSDAERPYNAHASRCQSVCWIGTIGHEPWP